ncbi:hypothetical protein PIB30_056347 [Stylosanthes scabra]|uniref:Uncharacterized protein n=1 Tax=Stylosanthes scabra TaxID=79078 RepID=A0ABU6XHA6_9FABA|nr:hypothetical protein [Stylosanthes scabra]
MLPRWSGLMVYVSVSSFVRRKQPSPESMPKSGLMIYGEYMMENEDSDGNDDEDHEMKVEEEPAPYPTVTVEENEQNVPPEKSRRKINLHFPLCPQLLPSCSYILGSPPIDFFTHLRRCCIPLLCTSTKNQTASKTPLQRALTRRCCIH